MLVYFLLFFSVSSIAFLEFKTNILLNNKNINFSLIIILFIFLLIFIGLRYQVGGDWENYINNYINDNELKKKIISLHRETGFLLINYLSNLGMGKIYFVNIFCGFLFSFALIRFCTSMPFPWLGLMISVPYLITVVALGYVRQCVSISIFMISLVALKNNKEYRYYFYNLLGIIFHISSIFVIPIAFFKKKKFKLSKLIIAITLMLILLLYMHNTIYHLLFNYLTISYHSAGSFIRALMNLIPSLLLLIYYSQLSKKIYINSHWLIMSIASCFLFASLFFIPSTTIIDRIGLFFIPLQIFVWTNLPLILKKNVLNHSIYYFILFFYCLAILLVWLLFGDNSFAWIPYKNLLWELVFNSSFTYSDFIKYIFN